MNVKKTLKWALPAWLLLLASILVPQAAYMLTGWVSVAVVASLVPLALLGWLLVGVAPTFTTAWVALGFAVAMAAGFGGLGGRPMQEAILLGAGYSFDGVTTVQAMALPRGGRWVRLTDAVVDKGHAERIDLVSGDHNKPASQRHHSYALAPLTLRPSATAGGATSLWACSEYTSVIGDWQGDVRGAMWRMDSDVAFELGRGGDDPWCVHLDRLPSLSATTENALAGALSFLLMFPLLVLVILLIAVHAPSKK